MKPTISIFILLFFSIILISENQAKEQTLKYSYDYPASPASHKRFLRRGGDGWSFSRSSYYSNSKYNVKIRTNKHKYIVNNYSYGRTFVAFHVYYLPLNYYDPIGYYSTLYKQTYYDGYGYNFYYGEYAYYADSPNPR